MRGEDGRREGKRRGQPGPESRVKSERHSRGRGEMREGQSEERTSERAADRQRHVGLDPGLSLAKVKEFASCQLETAACGERDAALRRLGPLVCPVCMCVCVRVSVCSIEFSGVLRAPLMWEKHETRTVCVSGFTLRMLFAKHSHRQHSSAKSLFLFICLHGSNQGKERI